MLIALVTAAHDTRHGPKVAVNVLRGQLAEGDEVVVTHSDGSQQRRRFVDVGKHPITVEMCAGIGNGPSAGPFKQEGLPDGSYRVGDLLQSPGGPPGELDESSELAGEIQRARSAGLNIAGPHLSDAIVAMHVQSLLKYASTHASGALIGSEVYNHVSEVLSGYGLQENADRAKLLASALREGYEPSPGVRGLASLGAGVINAVSFEPPLLIKAVGLAVEEGDSFSRGYRKGIAAQGEIWRRELMTAGRAVAIGWCKKCGDITTLTDKLECERCGRESERFRVVVLADRAVAEQELRAAGPPAKHGLLRR
ncbi:MAG: hypothetical protein ACXVH5_04725 [Ilumatobacteraceae bacterium]